MNFLSSSSLHFYPAPVTVNAPPLLTVSASAECLPMIAGTEVTPLRPAQEKVFIPDNMTHLQVPPPQAREGSEQFSPQMR